MRVYYFRCYWPSNLVFVVRGVTYISNLRKIGHKLQSLSKMNGKLTRKDRHTYVQTDRQTYVQVILYLFNAMHFIRPKIIKRSPKSV